MAAKVMEPVSSKLYELESQADRPRGRRAPRPPYRIAAEQTAALLGAQLSDQALDKARSRSTTGWRCPGHRRTRCSAAALRSAR